MRVADRVGPGRGAEGVSGGLTGNSVCFTVTPPQAIAVREADFVVTLGDGKGDLYWQVPVAQ